MLEPDKYGSLLEINVTDNCQLKCSQCNRLCNVACRENYISVKDVERMCGEVPRMKRICIAGGEPMLHPQIEDIVKTIKQADIADEILMLTNGISLAPYCDDIGERYGVTIWNSQKNVKQVNHTLLMTVAPVDLGLWKIKDPRGCDILSRCGLGFSSDGYYPCVISAAIGRIFGIDGARTFDDMTEDVYHDLIDKTCRFCGYYITSKENTILPEFNYPSCMISRSWVDALEKYNKEYPDAK